MINKITIRILSIIVGIVTAVVILAGIAILLPSDTSAIVAVIISGILSILVIVGAFVLIKDRVIRMYFLIPFIILCICYAFLFYLFFFDGGYSTITD